MRALLLLATTLGLFAGELAYAQESSTPSSLETVAKVARRRPRKVRNQSFSSVCAQVRSVGNAFLYKSALSDHIRNPGSRANSPTLICNRACPRFPAPIYYSDGTLAAKVGYYGKWDVTGKSRAYCGVGGAPTCNIRSIAQQSRSKKRDGAVYVQMNGGATGRNTVCYRVNPTGRTGAAK